MKLSTGIAMTAALMGCAVAQAGRAPQIDREDLAACKTEIVKLHEKEIDYLAYMEHNCSSEPGTVCPGWGDLKRQSIATDDYDWYMQGNDSCNGSDYPCFGTKTFNNLGETDEYRLGMAKSLSSDERPPLGPPPANDYDEAHTAVALNYWSWAADICAAKVFLAKADAASAVSESKEDADTSGSREAPASQDAAATSTASDGGIHAAQCAEALARQDDQFNEMTRKAPKPGEDKSAGGARALYQMGMYITDERLKVLDQFCKGEPQYAMYAGVKASFESALTGCKQVSSDGGESCKPLKLW